MKVKIKNLELGCTLQFLHLIELDIYISVDIGVCLKKIKCYSEAVCEWLMPIIPAT
jgi:hypothetical protein